MVTEPKILLADEPTGNLDTARGMEIMHIIERLNKERLMTTIVVTHDSVVAAIARRRIYLCDGVIVREEYASV
jgi:putative ABC transport system ATP-binding protein